MFYLLLNGTPIGRFTTREEAEEGIRRDMYFGGARSRDEYSIEERE